MPREYVTVDKFDELAKDRDDLLAALAGEHEQTGIDHGQVGHDGGYPDCGTCALIARVRGATRVPVEPRAKTVAEALAMLDADPKLTHVHLEGTGLICRGV